MCVSKKVSKSSNLMFMVTNPNTRGTSSSDYVRLGEGWWGHVNMCKISTPVTSGLFLLQEVYWVSNHRLCVRGLRTKIRVFWVGSGDKIMEESTKPWLKKSLLTGNRLLRATWKETHVQHRITVLPVSIRKMTRRRKNPLYWIRWVL